ncbi:MAG: DNA adenine methylase, partial [Planctomycetia bacterium]|nr:DNA adenine methylase [Planctomycetia bacterium]
MFLFKECQYFEHQFPKPQYLGAKYLFRHWITAYIDNEKINTVLDAFGGSQSIAYCFKQNGFKTITNDLLNFNNQIGLALVENDHEVLNEDDLSVLFSKNRNPDSFKLFEELYTDIFFKRSETQFLDAFRSNVDFLNNRYKKALAISIMNRSMTRKVTMGHFAHTKAMDYAVNPDRIKRNRSLTKPLKEIFCELLPLYNQAVFSNNQDNRSFCENILDLLPSLKNIDLVYFDPPYCGSHADYQSFYHLLETYTEYWKDKQFVNGTRKYAPKKYSGFEKKVDIVGSLNLMFE